MAPSDSINDNLSCNDNLAGKSSLVAKAPPAFKPIGFFEASGGVLAFIALVSFVTTNFDRAPRPPAPSPARKVSKLELAAPAAPAPAAPEAAPLPAATEAAAPLTLAASAPVEAAVAPPATAPEAEVAAPEAPQPVAEAPEVAPTSPEAEIATSTIAKTAAPQAATLPPSSFEFTNFGGKIHVSGVVADQNTRAALLDDLKAVHGAGSVTGAIAIDARRAPAAWAANMLTALRSLKAPGLTVLFSGGDIVVRGQLGDVERARLASILTGLFGGEVRLVALADHLEQVSARANAQVAASLAAFQPGFKPADLFGALNGAIINFASSSAEVPVSDRALLSEAAALIRQLPNGTLIEIAGHTDSTGGEEANVALSRRRAEAVRAALVKAGVSPAMVRAKGQGGAAPIASNDTVDGRFLNRRIEYRLARP